MKEPLLFILSFLGFPYLVELFGRSHIDHHRWLIVLWSCIAIATAIALWFAFHRLWLQSVRHFERGISERYADASEADEVWRICRTFYTSDDHVIKIDILRDYMSINPRTAKLFFQDGEPVGLYIIFPIRLKAVDKFRLGAFTSAKDLKKDHACKDRGKPSGLYVTNICAKGLFARGRALKSMLNDIRERIDRCPNIRFIFARMANADGGRIIRKYHFEKVMRDGPDQQVWMYCVRPQLPDELKDESDDCLA